MSDLFGNENILALSWKQPFAELMLHGKIETRTWATKYRGLVLICSSKKSYSKGEVFDIAGKVQAYRILDVKPLREMPMNGLAIAVGELVECRKMQPEDENDCFVQFREDLFCHVYKNVRAIEPIAWKGSQGWKAVSEEVIKQIKYI